MTTKDCYICKKTLGSIRSYNSHIKSKKHTEKKELQIEEDKKIHEVITKIYQNWEKDDWDDIIKTYILKWKLTAKQFINSFYRVLGGIINDESAPNRDKAITLTVKLSNLYNKEIPEWINIHQQSETHNINIPTTISMQIPVKSELKINSIIDMELMTVINQLSHITNIETTKSALLMMDKKKNNTQDSILHEIEKCVILSHNKTIIELIKAVDMAKQFMKHQIEYDLYSKYGKLATQDQVHEVIEKYKTQFPQLVNFTQCN